MKKVLLVSGLSLFAMACGNNNTAEQAGTHDHTDMQASTSNDPNAVVDPVCGMTEGDIAYTDFSVYQSDTVWFCSPHCKDEFDKDPAKYATHE